MLNLGKFDFERVDTGVCLKMQQQKKTNSTHTDRRSVMRMTVNKLRDESQALRKEVTGLKDQVYQMEAQSNLILKLISEQQSCITSIFRIETQTSCAYMQRFPIQSQQDLDAIEADINDETRPRMINTVRSLLTPGGIVKRLGNVLSTQICLNYNLEGIIKKKRLKNYANLLDVIFKATMKDGWTQKLFYLEIRQGLKLVKHRHFKSLCLMRKAERNQQQQKEEADEEDEDSDTNHL